MITSVKDPTDLHIEELFVVNSNIVLGLKNINVYVVEYNNHYHSWIVEASSVLLTLQIKQTSPYFVPFEDHFGNSFIYSNFKICSVISYVMVATYNYLL